MLKIHFALSLFVTSFIFQGFQGQRLEVKKINKYKFEKTKNVLFYIQRSINISTIIYELNVNEKEELNLNDPIKIYWKNYATDNSTQSLNYIQKKYAYGIETRMLDAKNETFCFNFVSYKKKLIYLIKSPVDNKYKAFCEIAGKFVILNKIFIQIEGGTFWFPKIKYIEVAGKDLTKNEDVTEKIIP